MKFSQDPATGHIIQSYQSGVLTIGNHRYRKSLFFTASQLVEDWGPATAEEIGRGHMSVLVDYQPELIILGTGERQVFPSPEIFTPLIDAGIGYEVMDTHAASRTYNLLRTEGRHVIAALIL